MKLYRIIGDIESKGFLLSVGSIIYPKLKKRHLRGRHHTLTPAIAVFLNDHIGILKWSPETAAHVLKKS